VSRAFAVWPAALLEAELNRERLAGAVRDALFAADEDGWRAYVASLTDEVSWFGEGLAPLPRGGAEAEAEAEAVARHGQPAQEPEKPRGTTRDEPAPDSGAIYPAWPWKP
jgi:hypothetical protein